MYFPDNMLLLNKYIIYDFGGHGECGFSTATAFEMTVGELSVNFVCGPIVPMVTEGNMSCN